MGILYLFSVTGADQVTNQASLQGINISSQTWIDNSKFIYMWTNNLIFSSILNFC